MSNSLNVRLVNMVTDIAQGDDASTVIVELLDENKLVIPTLNGKAALINFINKEGEIQYQFNTFVFDSRVEFNVDTVIPHGVYYVEIRLNYDDSTYVFPSSVNYTLRINKSANDFYNVAITENGVEVVANAVYQKMEAEIPEILEHPSDKENPHEVTKNQVGLGNVKNVKQATKTEFDDHVDDKENPHGVSKSQVGLGSVDNAKQATKVEFDTHNTDTTKHIAAAERSAWNGKVDKVAGKVLSSNDYTNAEKTKLTAIETGAQVNEVTSVNDKTGEVNVTKSDVGLGNVGNYGVATQAEAEAGTSSSKYMTPLRTKQAIDELAPIGGGESDFEDLTSSIVALNDVSIKTGVTRVYRVGKVLHIQLEYSTTKDMTPSNGVFKMPLLGYEHLTQYVKATDISDLTDLLHAAIEQAGEFSLVTNEATPSEHSVYLSMTILLDGI